jgi:hypothetical protein
MTTNPKTQTEFRAALETAADGIRPGPVPSAGVLAGAGRRTRRSRLRVGTAALAAGAAAIAASAFHPGGTPVPAATAQFRIVTPAQFGYLPAGFRAFGVSDGQSLASGPTGVALFLTTTNEPADSPARDLPVSVPGAKTASLNVDENGGPAADGAATLRWVTATGEHLTLFTFGKAGFPAWQEELPKIAAGVVIANQVVPMPFHLDRLPNGFTVEHSSLGGSVNGWSAQLVIRDHGDASTAWIDAARADDPLAESQVFGKLPPGSACKEYRGEKICVGASSGQGSALKIVGGTQGLLDLVVPLGTDPSAWTPDFIG